MCFLIFKQISLKHLLFEEELTVYYDKSRYFFLINYPTYLSDFKLD